MGLRTSLAEGEQTDPDSPQVERIDRLTQIALAAGGGSLPTRTALGFLRVIQDRPAHVRTVLADIDREVNSRLTAHRLAPDEPFVTMLDAVLAAKATERPGAGPG